MKTRSPVSVPWKIMPLALVWLSALAMVPGCDSGGTGGTARYPDAGLTMRLPPGWTMATNVHYQRGHRDDHFGTVMTMPLEGDTLKQHVRNLVEDEGFGFGLEEDVTSQQALEIDGHAAVELVTEAAYHVYELHILRDEQVVVVSFRTLPDAFADQIEAFRAAARSIRFE